MNRERMDESAELINSGLSDDGCGRELRAATAERLAEIYSTAYQESAQ